MEVFLDIKMIRSDGTVVDQRNFSMSQLGSQSACARYHTICYESTPLIDGNACLVGLTIIPDIIPSGYDDARANVDSQPASLEEPPHALR